MLIVRFTLGRFPAGVLNLPTRAEKHDLTVRLYFVSLVDDDDGRQRQPDAEELRERRGFAQRDDADDGRGDEVHPADGGDDRRGADADTDEGEDDAGGREDPRRRGEGEAAAVQLGMLVRVLADRSDRGLEEVAELAVERAEGMELR